MSTPKPPGGKSPKPFLGDDDLFSELDAWDQTFDALHGGTEAGEAAAEPPMAWPAPTESADPTALTLAAPPGDPTATLDDLPRVDPDVDPDADPDVELDAGPGADLDAELEAQLSLNGPHEDRAAAGRPMQTLLDPMELDAGETDFSDIGADARPAALGDLLGRGSAPRVDDEHTRVRRARPTRPPSVDEDEVYTSASRPNRAPASPYHTDDDVIAPPPPRAPVRRGPAIVRRATAPVQIPKVEDITPAKGTNLGQMFSDEDTRVALYDQVAHASARGSKQTAPPPIDEDDYADIEIDSDAAAPHAEISLDSAPVQRRTAHVVRRAETPARPAPTVRAVPEPVIEIDVGDDDGPSDARPRAISNAEDDFSDVAAAVGAQDDLELPMEQVRGTDDDDALGNFDVLESFDAPERGATVADAPGSVARARAQELPGLLDMFPRVKTPTSVPPLGTMPTPARADAARPRPAPRTAPPPRATAAPSPRDAGDRLEPALDLEIAGRTWPEQIDPMPSSMLDEEAAASLLIYEREVATLDDSESSAALRIEAGRLCERLADLDRARVHYDAALLADPRATAALRGLRRIARARGDLAEATRHLDAEIAVAGALERRPLALYRIDLLMASGDQDLARVAVGEMLDQAPSDPRALLAHLELAFLDGRAEEFGAALDQLAHAVTDPELRAAVQSARGVLAAHQDDAAGAARCFLAAAETDPAALAPRLGAIRYAASQADGEAAARGLVELARHLEAADPITAAGAALRAQRWSQGEQGFTAAAVATHAAPADPLVARLGAMAAQHADPEAAGPAFAQWANWAVSPIERAYAAGRAAELEPGRGVELWASVLSLDPGDDYAAAQLRTAHVASESTQASIEVDLAIASDVERDRARLRAAYGMIGLGELDAAIEVLEQGRAARPGSLALSEALGEALAAAGKWSERARLFAELAAEPGEQLDRDVAQLRSALAWEEAVGAMTATTEGQPPEELLVVTRAALDAWAAVLDHDPRSPTAHAAAIVLASRLGDRDVYADVLARAQAVEHAPAGAASLALRRARLFADDADRAEAVLRDVQPADDPRRTVALVLAAARKQDPGIAAAALEERANQLDPRGASTEIAALRLRAAQLALDDNDAARATQLLQQVEQALPHLGVVPDLLTAARRRAGERPSAGARPAEQSSGMSSIDAFARLVRDAELAASQGDGAAALALYQRALELRPGDPLAALPMIRTAIQLREATPLTGLALAQLRAAEDAGDGPAKASAYELLAHIDGELRGDPSSAQIALESASQSDPTRVDLLHRLERNYAAADQLDELLRVRRSELEVVPPEYARDRAALELDIAGLATRDERPELEVAELYRAVLAIDPLARLALLHLESIVRRSGASAELADLEEKIATYFDGDAKAQASFLTRAGETLAELGQIEAAVERFGRAETTLPGHIPALASWRQAALKGELWGDVAEAASRQAAGASEPARKAALYHLAGVALMDKALEGEQAMVAFRRALESEPGHKDAFLRLRILLQEDAHHDDLATLLAQRLDVEEDPAAKIELHRALAELHRNFLSDRETAKHHYKMLLESDPNDLRAHAAIADIAWELGSWQEAADALMARARLEAQPEVLKTLCFRLGLIYADRLVDVPMALKAFQRALTYQPDDENTLTRLADLATQAGEWKLALGACERLVKAETDPDRRAAHLQRVARIFKDGFGDQKRAERALNLALDGSPTNDEALQALVQFYRDAGDTTSLRVHLNRVAGAMRARAAKDPQDGVAYRVISRAMAARAASNVVGSRPIARAAAELAELLGTAGEQERKVLADVVPPDLSVLVRPEADDVLFPRGIQIELRQVFHLLGDRIAKHVGIDLRPYGATRGDRLRARDNPVASVAQSVATAMGFPGEIDVYVSNRQPWVMVAEPTSPVSLVIGSSIAAAGGDAIRFAAGGALKLAQASLAIPARLPLDELGVLVVSLLRLFQPEFPGLSVDADAVAGQVQKLKRLVPTGLLNELRPFALAIDPQHFSHRELARDLKIAALRAGLVASGSIVAGLRILAARGEDTQGELPSFLADPVAQGLIAFALGEDHATIAR